MDNEVLDLTLKEVSRLLEEQYDMNKNIGVPLAALVMKGFNIHDAKRMVNRPHCNSNAPPNPTTRP